MRQLSGSTGREETDTSTACGKCSALVAVVSKACYYAAAWLNVESQAFILKPLSRAFSLRAEKQHGLIKVACSFTKARKAAHPKTPSLGSANLNRGSKRAEHKTNCC